MTALPALRDDETFCAFASDGTDNSDCAGVIIDVDTRARAKELGLDVTDYLSRFAGYDFFNKLGHEQIFTGNTESNVADLMVVLRKM
jgi:glycerate-2-kinase